MRNYIVLLLSLCTTNFIYAQSGGTSQGGLKFGNIEKGCSGNGFCKAEVLSPNMLESSVIFSYNNSSETLSILVTEAELEKKQPEMVELLHAIKQFHQEKEIPLPNSICHKLGESNLVIKKGIWNVSHDVEKRTYTFTSK